MCIKTNNLLELSKLLEILDEAVCHDSEAIKAAVMDKAYMVQLVQVQQRRGAQGGQIFSSVLTLNEELMLMYVEDNVQTSNKIQLTKKGILFNICILYNYYNYLIILVEPKTLIEKNTDLNVDLIIKNLFSSKMEGNEFLSLLQVSKII